MRREFERQGCHTVPALSVGLARILMLVPLSSSNPNPNPHIMSSPSQRTVKEIIATFCIPSQHLSGLDTDHPRRGGSSISSTKVKREAVVQGVLRAIPDEIQHRRRRAEEEEEEEGPTGFRFISTDNILPALDDIYSRAIDSDAPMPGEFHTIWRYDEVWKGMYGDDTEEDVCRHLEATVILALNAIFSPRAHNINSTTTNTENTAANTTPRSVLLDPPSSRQFKRATNTASRISKDGKTDFLAVGDHGNGGFRHPPLWEVKRAVVWLRMFFGWTWRAGLMKGGIKVCVEEDGKGAFVRWPGGAGEEWKKTEMLGKRSVVDNVLKQVGLEAFMVLLSFSSCLCGCGSGFGEGETGREEGGGGGWGA